MKAYHPKLSSGGMEDPFVSSSDAGSSAISEYGAAEISILIVAHQRREYLRRAVESARGQVAPGVRFEIVVVKDFADPWVDGLEGSPLVHCLAVEPGPVGQYLACGIAACSGKVICFLDDDDAFLPGKIARVHAAFRAEPALAYLHNGNLARRDDQAPVRSVFRRGYGEMLELSGNGERAVAVRRVMAHSMAVNLSSVSVATSLLLRQEKELARIEGSTDYFLLYLALASGRPIRFDPTALTAYYVHESATRPGHFGRGFDLEFARLATAQCDVHAFGEGLPPSVGAREIAVALGAEWSFLKAVAEGASRRDIIRRFARFVVSSLRSRSEYVVMGLPVFLAALVWPPLGLIAASTGRRVMQN